ncbi:hypothetical protein MRB53_031103 [Persea americana]|uniref:Uncharacterized protein n=1 Tax=Persea americana TaxID=3435 RepID=A0ACC2KNM1_PERAE|nr:hypothetical protein MRB53_031103 [Persea americana]
MAKKKVSKQEKPQPASPPHEHLSEQMVNLKALNNLLVRETVEHRDQIHTLRRTNHSLQSKISQILATHQTLKTQESLCEDRLLAAEIERDISIVFASLQLRQNEIKSEMPQKLELLEKEKEVLLARIAVLEEIELKEMQEETNRLVRELGRTQRDLGVKREEVNGLKLMVNELRVSYEEAREEMGSLRMECECARKEKWEVEERMGSLREDRDSIQRTLHELMERYEDLRKGMGDAINERNELDKARNEMGVELIQLQEKVGLLAAEVSSNQGTLDRVLLERDALQNDLDLQKTKEKRNFESFITEKASLERGLTGSALVIEDLNRKMEEMLGDKNSMECTMAHMEVVTADLQNEVIRCSATIDTLRESCGALGETNNQLVNDLSHQKDLLDLVRSERNVALVHISQLKDQIKQLKKEVGCLSTTLSALQESCRECKERNSQLQADMNEILHEKDVVGTNLNCQRQETEVLRLKLREMEKNHEEKQQELLHLKTEKGNLVEEMEERQICFELLMKAKDSIQSSLVESQQGLKDLQVKAELAEMFSKQTLSMLKHAAETMNGLVDEEKSSKGVNGIDEEQINDEIRPFVTELKAIKKAFRSRLQEVEEKNRELKSLQISVAKSKNWSFWTWLSSATTIVAVISIAYFAKGL